MMLLSALIIRLGLVAAAFGSSRHPPDSKLAKNVLEQKREGYCSPSGPIESTHCLYENVENLNTDLYPKLHQLVQYPFFRNYKVDLYRECPFWYENAFCMNRDCGVTATEENEIPVKWRAKALSQVTHPEGAVSVEGCYFREQDFCYIEDDATQDGEYIDLTLNPERFTGYAGDSAHNVWRAIYEENCFGLSEAALTSNKGGMASAVVGAGRSLPSKQTGFGFSKLSEGWGTEMVRSDESGMCEEKRIYYRIISGLHASISIHICHEYLDQTTGEWSPNLQCFISRLGAHPERLSNVYFNTVLLLRAMARAKPYLEKYDISVAPLQRLGESSRTKEMRAEDKEAKESLSEVLKLAAEGGTKKGFDEGEFFHGPDAILLKEQFKTHFRNVSRIMDCVGCDKCRLWGKLQVSGIGTALKILFELDEKALDPRINPDLLQRSEVVALFNTLHRLSESLAAVEEFRRMYKMTQENEAIAAKSRAERQMKKQMNRKKIAPPPPKPSYSIQAIFGAIVAAIEGFRRSCRGCLEICWSTLEKGPFGDLLGFTRRFLGVVSKKEL